MNFLSSILKKYRYSSSSFIFFSVLLLGAPEAHSQIWKKAIGLIDNSKRGTDLNILPIDINLLQTSMQTDYHALTSPKLGGRLMGTKGAEMAGMYIGTTMNGFGVAPYARNFVHTFNYVSGKEYTPETRLTVGSKYLFIPEDAFPVPYSSIGEVQSYVLPNSKEFGQPWIIPLYENPAQATNSEFDWISETYKRALIAQKKGASTILFYDNVGGIHAPHEGERTSLPELKIPVLVISHNAYKNKVSNIQTLTPFYLNLKLRDVYAKTANIIGYIDNNAKLDVVICAHYDGGVKTGIEGSIATTDNDDVSGVTVMMAVARLLTKSSAKNYNYILTAFSGENKGLLGSKALFDDKSFESSKVAYVINLGQIGNFHRNGKLCVSGVTSSLGWVPFFKQLTPGVHFRYVGDENAKSDQLTFLAHHIPALSFSADVENDFQDSQSMNFVGADSVVSMVYRLVVSMNGLPRPVFAAESQKQLILHELERKEKHNEPIVSNETRAPEKSITLNKETATIPPTSTVPAVGIILDSTYNGYGVRILSIVEKQAAQIAGLEKGDIIMEMGGKKINNASDYEQEIEALKENEKIEVKVKRGATVQEFSLHN